MSDRGVFAVDRGIFDHPIFAPEPFTEREAWLWLVGSAAWKAMRVRVGRHVVDLERGECAFALRFLATRWKWSEPRVRRFLNRLKNDAMVLVSPTREATHITICNYDRYAFGRRADEAESDAQGEQPATRARRKEEEIKNSKKEESKESSSADLFDAWPRDAFEKFWKSYPHKIGKAAAVKAFAAAKRTGVTFERLMFGLERYINEKPPDRPWCNPATWLNGGRWEDEPAPVTSTGPPRRSTGGNGMAALVARMHEEDRENAGHEHEFGEPEIFAPGPRR